MMEDYKIAVLVPCYNEEITIGKVVRDFASALKTADVYVYDNNSSDETVERAKKAGAIVRGEPEQGKGNVVRRMFADIEADIYVLVDGDDTYDVPSAKVMIQRLIDENLDMVVGVRSEDPEDKKAYPLGHSFGNRMFNIIFRNFFGDKFTDIFSGYRVFSRRFVKSFPALASGFETETEISIHAAELKLPTAEIRTPYYSRPEGSVSKLNTIKDGVQILGTIFKLFKEVRPFLFFNAIAFLLVLAAVILGIPIITVFLETGLVPRFPTAFGVVGLSVLAAISITCGLVLDSVTLGRLEQKRLHYLSLKLPRD